ncbi:hypothetical protein KZC51_06145 [Microbacterium sp. SSW1-49]|uniref:Uncharacterized protein n=1 Tax=Microbacterium croceum TaxID=2851645 RepID=A0ABT0FCC8_9MICO|nr:hypothetical protein [Microbacterium croceum]MCK2035713.1 hypothetical protein [Microbacterium croceum]
MKKPQQYLAGAASLFVVSASTLLITTPNWWSGAGAFGALVAGWTLLLRELAERSTTNSQVSSPPE